MNRSPLMGRLGLRGKAKNKHRVPYAHLGIEPLEERRLLSAYDVLVSTPGGNSSGESVLRYDDTTQLPVPGGVATGAGGLENATGVAVAPDGSYYVSNGSTHQVLHYGNSGVFLDALGAGDAIPAPLVSPAALAFGPNGNLYVADSGADKIFQFDTSSSTQQFLSGATLPLGFTPGGIAFASDPTHDLIVGDVTDQSVLSYHGAAWTPLVSDVNPVAVLSEANGNLLIADAGGESGLDQILVYSNAPTPTTTQIINFTTPLGTGALAPQPTSLLLDTDGSLLVGLSSDGLNNGAVEKFDIQTTPAVLIGTIATGISNPSGLALAPSQASDLLVGNFTGGGVARYSTAAQALVGGGVDFGDNGDYATSGVAVAPDGSFYVSSLLTGQVLHYSNAGVFQNFLDTPDNPVEQSAGLYYEPGTLAFGPNGNLYVADLSGFIYQFDTTAPAGQQYLSQDTLNLLQYGISPGGFTFAADTARDLIVGDLENLQVVRFHDGVEIPLPPLAPPPGQDVDDGVFPAAILPLGNNNLLIADTDDDFITSEHHEIVEYNMVTGVSTQFIDLTTPVGPVDPNTGLPEQPQPTSLAFAPDGNLLVGLSPDETYGDGVVQEFDIATGQLMSTVVSSIGTPAGLAFAPPNEMTVPAADWPGPGLTIAQSTDDNLHVYQSNTNNPPVDVVPPQSTDSVGGIQIIGPDNAANTLTIDFSGGNPIPPDGVTFDGGSGSATNTVIISGSPDLSGTIQTAGSVTFGQCSLSNEALAGSSLAIQSGTVIANLTGPGGLNKTGSGTVTLSGSDSYQGDTMVTAGTLVATTSTALPAGSSLTVGAGGSFIFDPSATAGTLVATTSAALPAGSSPTVGAGGSVISGPPAVPQTPQAVSSHCAAVNVSPSATGGALASAATIRTAAAVVAPLQGQALVSHSTAAAFLSATLPAAQPVTQPAALPSRLASNSFWSSYPQATGPAAGPAHGAAGCLAWSGSSVQPSNAEDSTTEEDRRIAVLDAVLAQYGSP